MSKTGKLKEMLDDLSDPILADWITETAERIIRRCATIASKYGCGPGEEILAEAGLDGGERDGE